MKSSSLTYMKLSVFVVVAFVATMVYTGPAHAGDYTMGTNLNSMSELMGKFSKMLSSGKVDAKTQQKMGDIMSRMSQVLGEMAGPESTTMTSDHNQKIDTMKKEFDPFDTSDKM